LLGAAIASSKMLWYRQFDTAATLVAIWIAVRVVEEASTRWIFTAGVLVALIAGFGRNHGLYSAVPLLAVIVVATSRIPSRARLSALGIYVAGIVFGYLPIIAHWLLVPGYFDTLWDSIMRELRTGNTNIPLPVPWPWLLPLRTLPWPEAIRSFGIGILFVSVPLTYALGLVVLLRYSDRADPAYRLLLASVAVGIPYLHHAFSRASDVYLLEGSQAFIPAVVALLALASRRAPLLRPQIILPVCLVGPFLAVNIFHQQRIAVARSVSSPYAVIDGNGSMLKAPSATASIVAALRDIQATKLRAGETMLIAPHWPMAYALLRLRSPIWEIYHLFARSDAFQHKEIAELERRRVELVVFADIALDNRDDRRLSTQEPLLYQYLLDNYAPIEGPALPQPYRLYRRRKPFEE